AALSRVSLSGTWQTTTTPWPWLYAAAALLLVAAAVLTLLRAGRWAPRPDRYRRDRPAPDADDPTSVWRALDAGEDPTAEPRTDQPGGGGVRSTRFPPPVARGTE
ncbi:Trp biosynthesis-associated membrane protein, partial [Desertihabitans aurantiacus]|uniref:Trp biosynthesis-associated membrane protein n=1 Tax=Desertihabitans aurantiacus TaxID=2282477 RepID=UPI0018E53174